MDKEGMEEQQRTLEEHNRSHFNLEGEDPQGEEEEQRPEDCIPDLPENQAAREFLRTAPTHGLFMPLGKEVKVMQCWRCKAFGHRLERRYVQLELIRLRPSLYVGPVIVSVR